MFIKPKSYNLNQYLIFTKYLFSFIIILFSLLLILYPNIDISFSNLFYDRYQGFYFKHNLIIVFLYNTVPILTKSFTAICLVGIIYKFIKFKSYIQVLKSPLVYLLVAAILGPGLLVNHIFKDQFGRARPSQIQEFNGDKYHTNPFELSNQCMTNCSFTSGHAAMAFYFTALAYIVPASISLPIYIAGVLFGISVGLARIAQGGHFLSDVFFSGVCILLLNHFIYKVFIILKNKKASHH